MAVRSVTRVCLAGAAARLPLVVRSCRRGEHRAVGGLGRDYGCGRLVLQ
jgi:hypothetical protein